MESISAFEMIKLGIGPSSSHTMGPWIASRMFIQYLKDQKIFSDLKELSINLYGSLAKTGKGHGTDIAVLMGLSGERFETIDPLSIDDKVNRIKQEGRLNLSAEEWIDFNYEKHLLFKSEESLEFHANGMEFIAKLADGQEISKKYYSLGGGFVATDEINTISRKAEITPHPCHKAKDILENCRKLNLRVSDLIYLNEETWRSRAEIEEKAYGLWLEMKDCIYRGVQRTGLLPGGLKVKRRAPEISRKLLRNAEHSTVDQWMEELRSGKTDYATINKWISCFALAVNEENASFGRVVTAPTNGAAGVLPAVLMYASCFLDGFNRDKIIRFILTAGEIATIFKKNATISAAMGGCQAEIGVSSAMAAAGLTEALGGSPGAVLMAAEIAMEHHLGLTCDPVLGLVQIPCIERNAMGAVKAVTASNLALESDPLSAKVSLDAVISTMWDTAQNMNTRYKETSEGGLAISVNISEC